MRSIDPILTAALTSGTGTPYLLGYIGRTDGSVLSTGPVLSYKLTGTTLEFETQRTSDMGGSQDAMWLERGVTLGGTRYTLTTGRFCIQSQHYTPGRMLARGALFPREQYAAGGDDTYRNVISAFCAAYGKTAVFRDAAAAWLDYTFFPAGKSIILNDANSFLALLRQKYLLFACDNGNEEILFYCCAGSLNVIADHTLTPAYDFFKDFSRLRNRSYVWRDENGTVHTSGSGTDPIHNLGYLESSATAPERNSAPQVCQAVTRPDLRIQDGDVAAVGGLGNTVKVFALVTEQYTSPLANARHPRWRMTVDSNEVFGNTAGGALPSTIERVSNYTPLNTSMFGGVLSSSQNNLQAAMDALDNHAHYALQGMAASFNPADGATYYFGAMPNEPPQTVAGRCRMQIPRAGVIKAVKVWWVEWGGTAGSAEAITANVYYGGASTLIGSVSTSSATRAISNYAMSLPVDTNYLEIELVCPTWGTNPTAVRLAAVVYIETS